MKHRGIYQWLFMLSMLSVMVSGLSGCSSEGAYVLEPQYLGDMEFLVEIRPGNPREGMNEFLVVATEKTGKPGYAYVVSLQMQGDSNWSQAIQDGRSGVYRRAVYVKDPVNGVLQVKISKRVSKKETLEHTLSFPLSKRVLKTQR